MKHVYCKDCKFNIPTYLGHGIYKPAHCGYQEWNEFTGQLSFECTYSVNNQGNCSHYQEKEPSFFKKLLNGFNKHA